jgi:hypothetical protein
MERDEEIDATWLLLYISMMSSSRARSCRRTSPAGLDPSREGRPPDTAAGGARPAAVPIHRHWRHPHRQVEERKPTGCCRCRGGVVPERHARLVAPRGCWRGHVVAFLERQPLVGDVAERRGHDDHGPRGDERAGHAATDDLPLAPGQERGEAGGPRRRRGREEGAREGEYLEPAVERGHRRRGRPGLGGLRLAQRDVGDGPGRREHADAALPAARVGGERLENVAPGGDLEDVRPERVGALPGDDHGRLGLVLGPRRAAARAARDDLPAPDAGSSSRARRTSTPRSRRQRVLAVVGARRSAVIVVKMEGLVVVVQVGAGAQIQACHLSRVGEELIISQ